MVKKSLLNFIDIPKVLDDCELYFAQENEDIPFKTERIFYVLKPDPKFPRGFHAHKKTKLLLFCIQGSVEIVVDDGDKKERTVLNNPSKGLFIDHLIWHEMHNFRKNTILLVLASKKYSEEDYIRIYPHFIRFVKK